LKQENLAALHHKSTLVTRWLLSDPLVDPAGVPRGCP
jgi:hypothetical protein